MVKAPIKDSSIRIKPSAKLIDFVKSLNDTTIDLPKNLLKIYEAFTQDTRKRNVCKQVISPVVFTEEERKLLIAFSDDAFQNTTDIQNCIKSLDLYICNENNDNDNIGFEVGAISKDELIEKKDHQMLTKQHKKEISKLLLNLSDLKWIQQYLSNTRNENDSIIYLHELIEGSQLILPSNEFTERNPELEERCQRLKREQDEQKYRLMTKNVDCSRSYEPEETIAYQGKNQLQIKNEHFVAIITILLHDILQSNKSIDS